MLNDKYVLESFHVADYVLQKPRILFTVHELFPEILVLAAEAAKNKNVSYVPFGLKKKTRKKELCSGLGM